MTGLFDVNKDAIYDDPASIARGPKLGFLGTFEAAYNDAWTTASDFGAEASLRGAEQENISRIRKAGGTPPSSLNVDLPGTFNAYTKLVRAIIKPEQADPSDEGRTGFTAARNLTKMIGDRNAKLKALQAQYPDAGIQTYDDIISNVRNAGIKGHRFNATNGGGVGGFLGGMVASVDPRVNPLNAVTLPIGGFGKSLLGRVLTQAGGQGAIEAVNQFTGARENQQFFGQNPTVADSLESVAMAAAGGAVLQGAGEAIGAGLRAAGRRVRTGRWFEGPDAPPAPELPPVDAPVAPVSPGLRGADWITLRAEATTPVARAALHADMDELGAKLASWAEAPWSVDPPGAIRSDTALPPRTADIQSRELPDVWKQAANGGADINDVARGLDPNTFRVYDKLNAQRVALREAVGLATDPEIKAKADAAATEAIAAKERAIERAKTTEQIDRLTEELNKLKTKEDPTITAAQIELKQLEAKIQKLYPTIERAYARSQGVWRTYEGQRAQIKAMVDQGASRIDPLGVNMANLRRVDAAPRATITDHAPELARVTPLPGETAVDTVQRAVADNLKTMDDAVAQYQSSVTKMLSDANEKGVVEIEGNAPLKLDDKIVVPNEDGAGEREISIKQLLQEAQEDLETFKAVGSCSAAKTS